MRTSNINIEVTLKELTTLTGNTYTIRNQGTENGVLVEESKDWGEVIIGMGRPSQLTGYASLYLSNLGVTFKYIGGKCAYNLREAQRATERKYDLEEKAYHYI